MDERLEGLGEFVVARGDATEETLDQMAIFVEVPIERARTRQEGCFHPEPIRQKWAEHLSGQRNWSCHLWDVLMFQARLESLE